MICKDNAIALRSFLEDIFNKYGVSLVLSGQLRSYERLSSMYKGKVDKESVKDQYINVHYPTYINCGLGGSQQKIIRCIYIN